MPLTVLQLNKLCCSDIRQYYIATAHAELSVNAFSKKNLLICASYKRFSLGGGSKVREKGVKEAFLFFFFNKDFIYLFLDRGEGREKERERNISVWLPLVHPLLGTWPATQACALTGNRTCNPLVLRPALSPLSHSSKGEAFLFIPGFCVPLHPIPLCTLLSC